MDGDYYQLLAKKLETGQRYVIEGIKNKANQDFSPYPPGYPIFLIAGNWAENLSGINSILILHTFFLLILFIIWRRMKLDPYPLVLIIFTDTFLELGSYRWSEFVFVLFLIAFAIMISRNERDDQYSNLVFIILICLSIFLIRYAGIFLFNFIAYKLLTKRALKAGFKFWKYLGIGLSICISGWFFYEIKAFGQPTGGDRYANQDSYLDLLHGLGLEICNQVSLFKDVTGSSLPSFALGSIAFIGFFVWLIAALKNKSVSDSVNGSMPEILGKNLMTLGIAYFLFIVPIRWYFYFAEGFDLRLLGPGFILFFLGIFVYMFSKYELRGKNLFILFWILAAIFFSIPKKEVYLEFQKVIWGNTKPIF